MNYYYADCSVSFTDNSENKPWKSSEAYSFIVQAENKKEGKADAEKQTKAELKRQLGEMDEVEVKISQFYKTTECARAD
ncbi:MAG: hypothetical protein HN704_14685 [Bacteroidetes bacterium]|jgi:hypothetical protein|nr:hypothetical protein [Bacteroidota bacterium]MBT7492844.1 hypothetical protein [Bacteroidota bacterium]